MNLLLDPIEVRVLGSLLEKELTTPDIYPLSLAGLTASCNQKSSREPVMSLDENAVLDGINTLVKKHLVRERGGAGSRVPKYAHRLSDTLNPAEEFSRRERSVLGLLLLRGPQTMGELRTRSGRMYEFSDLDEVEQSLQVLAARPEGPWVAELPRRAGQRERRFMHLLSGEQSFPTDASEAMPSGDATWPDRLSLLEEQVALLQAEVAELRARLESPGDHDTDEN